MYSNSPSNSSNTINVFSNPIKSRSSSIDENFTKVGNEPIVTEQVTRKLPEIPVKAQSNVVVKQRKLPQIQIIQNKSQVPNTRQLSFNTDTPLSRFDASQDSHYRYDTGQGTNQASNNPNQNHATNNNIRDIDNDSDDNENFF
jgi:hypothetical protein